MMKRTAAQARTTLPSSYQGSRNAHQGKNGVDVLIGSRYRRNALGPQRQARGSEVKTAQGTHTEEKLG